MNEFLSMAIYIVLALFAFNYDYLAYKYNIEKGEYFDGVMDWLKWIIVFFIFGNFIVILEGLIS